jgi:hypothetical protein
MILIRLRFQIPRLNCPVSPPRIIVIKFACFSKIFWFYAIHFQQMRCDSANWVNCVVILFSRDPLWVLCWSFWVSLPEGYSWLLVGYVSDTRLPGLLLGSIVFFFRCRDSVVGIATGYGLDDRRGRSSSPGMVKNFLFSTSSRPALGSTQPPIQLVPGALSPGVKRQGREADHSLPATAEVYY